MSSIMTGHRKARLFLWGKQPCARAHGLASGIQAEFDLPITHLLVPKCS